MKIPERQNRAILSRSTLLLLACCAVACDDERRHAAGAEAVHAPAPFLVEELLTNPTATSVQLALLPAEPVEIYVEYGESQASLTLQTPTLEVGTRELAQFTLDRLLPDREYAYRVKFRRSASDAFQARAVHTVRTLHKRRDATVRFAYAADSHITERWITSRCRAKGSTRLEVDNFLRTLEHLRATNLDFVIAAGDNFMTHSNRLEPCEGWTRIGRRTARTAEQADLRYELALSPELWGSVTKHLPFFYVLGNHDGEARFGDARGYYGHYPETRSLSRGARLRHLPDPTRVYHGSRNGDLYFTFTTGDVRFIILDVMSGPESYPVRPEDWTLGPDQLQWLERVLQDNDRTWTFVFIEHLVGGVPGLHTHLPPDPDRPGYAYGRGGILSTLDGTPTAEFVGEQALLQKLMRENGVQLFFHAHDHVALVGEKLDAEGRGEGVHYVMGGQASSRGPRWARLPRFRQNTDYDGDGEPDFLSGINGTAKPGFYRVTVRGGSGTEVAYVASDADTNGEVIFSFTVLPDGSSTL